MGDWAPGSWLASCLLLVLVVVLALVVVLVQQQQRRAGRRVCAQEQTQGLEPRWLSQQQQEEQ